MTLPPKKSSPTFIHARSFASPWFAPVFVYVNPISRSGLLLLPPAFLGVPRRVMKGLACRRGHLTVTIGGSGEKNQS